MFTKAKSCLFVGNFYIQQILDEYREKYALSLGNDNYEKTFLKILKEMYEKVNIITFPSLPIDKNSPILTNRVVSDSDSETVVSLGFAYKKINFFLNKKKTILKELDAILNSDKEIDCIFLSTYNHFSLINHIKKSWPSIKTVLLLPDLPNVFIGKNGLLYKIRMKFLWREMHKNINKFDVILPITEYELQPFKKQHFKTFVYETYFDATVFNGIKQEWKKQILYAGSINESYGIENLVNSFLLSKTSKEYELIICGNGDYKTKLEKIISQNDSIKYLGVVSHDTVLKLERESTLLVVPDSEERPYSFHSRYLEYLSSGTPVLSYIPVGAKKDYHKFLCIIDKQYISDFSFVLDSVIYDNLESAKNKGKQAREFMIKNKDLDHFASEIYRVIYE